MIGVGYAAASALVSATFDTKPDPRAWFVINTAVNLLALAIVAVIVSTWQ